MKLSRLTRIFGTIIIVLLLASCSSSGGGKTFRYDLGEVINTLDPQYATGKGEQIILLNTYEGLFKKQPDGTVAPLVAESYEISEDELTYKFKLKENLSWNVPAKDKSLPALLTAYDFVFAFERILGKSFESPFKETYGSIQRNADGSIGVKAVDLYYLEIKLSKPDPLLIEKLAGSSALPCNREFFESCRGRYGLEAGLILGNGPFKVTQWQAGKSVFLKRNADYALVDTVLPESVNFYMDREEKEELFFDGKADVLKVDNSSYKADILASAESVVASKEVTWAIVFNSEDEIWGMPLLRQSLAYTADYSKLNTKVSEEYEVSSVLIPPAVTLNGKDFSSSLKSNHPIAYNEQKGRELYTFSLKTLGLTRMPNVILHVPKNGNHELYMGLLQQGWQQHLSMYVNIQSIEEEDIKNRLKTGDFQMLLVPITATDNSPSSVLNQFVGNNNFNYKNEIYEAMLSEAINAVTFTAMEDYYTQAHNTLISDSVVIPVYTETINYALGKGVENIEVFPFGNFIYFKNATKS